MNSADIRKPPDDFVLAHEDNQITNFDHTVSYGLEDLLRSGKIYCYHTAWEFHGDVWFEDGLFHERVNRYHVAVAHHEAPTLQELMQIVNDEHGWE